MYKIPGTNIELKEQPIKIEKAIISNSITKFTIYYIDGTSEIKINNNSYYDIKRKLLND